jgi:sigma-B regulation protein RsbU (phosphoserine phosphatase)
MVSALDQLDSVIRCIELGADDYLSKPINPVLLKARISACLEKKQLRDHEVEHLESLARAREAEHARKTQELEYARKVQLSLLPKADISAPGVEIVGRMTTATEVGGDYYDFGKWHEGLYAFALGDATGHGVAAGMVAGMTKTGLLMGLQTVDPAAGLAALIQTLNTTLRRSITQRGIGMALAAGVLDMREMVAEVSSNGIPYPYHYRRRTRELVALDLKAPPLGFLKKIPVPTRRVRLEPGDALVFVSDGFAERLDADRQQWGYDTVDRELLAICRSEESASAIAARLFEACDAFANGRETDDDMTVLVVKAT